MVSLTVSGLAAVRRTARAGPQGRCPRFCEPRLNEPGLGTANPDEKGGTLVMSLDTVVAALPETRLTLAGLLRSLHRQGRLGPLVREALAAQVVQEAARRAGLSVAD